MQVLEDKTAIQYSEVAALMESMGWGSDFYGSEANFKYMLEKTSYLAYIRQDNLLIGYGRILEDGVHCMFYDICVHPAYQNQGLGRKLMEHLIAKLKKNYYVTIGLFCEPNNATIQDFYTKLGFENVDAMDLSKLCRQ